MKSILLFSLCVIHANGQGLVDFDNRNLRDPLTGVLYHAPVRLPDESLVRGNSFTAGLFLVQGQDLTPVVTTPFREPFAEAGYFVPVFGIQVGGLPSGSPATFRARVWETSAGSYENAMLVGQYYGEFVTASGSPNIFIPHLGMQNPPGGIPTPDMSGIQPLTLIPEPSLLTLLGFATAFMLVATASFTRTNG